MCGGSDVSREMISSRSKSSADPGSTVTALFLAEAER